MTVEAILHGTIHHRDVKLLQHYSNIAPLKIVFDTTMYFFFNFLNFFLTLKLTPLSRAAEVKPGTIR